MIYYYAQKYSIDPDSAWERTKRVLNEFIKKDMYVFSPIAHTHQLEVERKDLPIPDYYCWDLHILSHFKEVEIVVDFDDIKDSPGVRRELLYATQNKITIREIHDVLFEDGTDQIKFHGTYPWIAEWYTHNNEDLVKRVEGY